MDLYTQTVSIRNVFAEFSLKIYYLSPSKSVVWYYQHAKILIIPAKLYVTIIGSEPSQIKFHKLVKHFN